MSETAAASLELETTGTRGMLPSTWQERDAENAARRLQAEMGRQRELVVRTTNMGGG